MKFIFPQNYHFESRFLGFIDYPTLFFNILWGMIVYSISHIFFQNLAFQISFFIILFFPIFLLSIIGFNHEKFLYILKYIFLYIKSPKIYLYKKEN